MQGILLGVISLPSNLEEGLWRGTSIKQESGSFSPKGHEDSSVPRKANVMTFLVCL